MQDVTYPSRSLGPNNTWPSPEHTHVGSTENPDRSQRAPKPYSCFLNCTIWLLEIPAAYPPSEPHTGPEIATDNSSQVTSHRPPSLPWLTEPVKEMGVEAHFQWQRQEFAN